MILDNHQYQCNTVVYMSHCCILYTCSFTKFVSFSISEVLVNTTVFTVVFILIDISTAWPKYIQLRSHMIVRKGMCCRIAIEDYMQMF